MFAINVSIPNLKIARLAKKRSPVGLQGHMICCSGRWRNGRRARQRDRLIGIGGLVQTGKIAYDLRTTYDTIQ